MRLRALELIRYGKFTDASLAFPAAAHDFHLVVGRNEAGKSTVRGAISELLFGMPRSSPMGFVHAQSELRLGAIVEGEGGALAFHRTKATRNPLRTPADAPLADEALAALLGGADRVFFEQMFGLDHGRLIDGGKLILDARSDVGAALFQSAAGIASLGAVRDSLAAQADALWGPRRAADRAYYKAQTQLEEAQKSLKELQVRTPAWSEARARLD
ncbi:MAG TPA: AAA family ATPase, partial [Ramlibacter sp.]|nr:AAA family ATPase [Ramlibacter sp.]